MPCGLSILCAVHSSQRIDDVAQGIDDVAEDRWRSSLSILGRREQSQQGRFEHATTHPSQWPDFRACTARGTGSTPSTQNLTIHPDDDVYCYIGEKLKLEAGPRWFLPIGAVYSERPIITP